MTVALYCRVSTDEQAEHGFSIDNQKERLIAFCKSQGWDQYRLYIDDGYTGTNMDRPALQRLIKHIKEKKIDTVIVYKLDRLSRKQRDVLYLLEDVFDKNNVVFKSATEPFDTSTPLGKAMLGILAVFAQLERDTIIERLSTGQKLRVKSGKFSGGRIPFGYVYNSQTGKFEVSPHEAFLVREVYKKYLQGYSLSDLSDWIESQTSARYWDHARIRDMLTRETYTGVMPYGTLRSTEIAPPIIERELWEQVQQEMVRRREGFTPKGEYLLSGLLRCAECGSSFIHVIRKKGPYVYYLYGCRSQHQRPKKVPRRAPKQACTVGYRNREELESWVIEQVKRIARLDAEEFEHQIANIETNSDETEDTLRDLRKNLSDIEHKLNRWYEAFEEGTIDATQLRDRIKHLEEERRRLQTNIEELQDTLVKDTQPQRVFNAAKLIEEAWDYMTFDEKRNVLRAAISYIEIPRKGQPPVIHWNV